MHSYLPSYCFQADKISLCGFFLYRMQTEILIQCADEPSRQVEVHRDVTSSVKNDISEV